MAKYNIRKANRSGTRPCTICEAETALELHHMRGRDVPNAHSDHNVVWLCPTCHSECHLGWKVIEGWFKTTNGRELIWRLKDDPTITGQICTPPLTL